MRWENLPSVCGIIDSLVGLLNHTLGEREPRNSRHLGLSDSNHGGDMSTGFLIMLPWLPYRKGLYLWNVNWNIPSSWFVCPPPPEHFITATGENASLPFTCINSFHFSQCFCVKYFYSKNEKLFIFNQENVSQKYLFLGLES